MKSKQIQRKSKKCVKTKKTKFHTQILARKAMMWIWSHDPSADLRDLHVYECESCKGWHVGHFSDQKVKTRIYQTIPTTGN